MAKEKPLKQSTDRPDKKVTIEIPQGQFPVVMYANAFGLESVDGHKLVHFGLVMPPARLISAWACIIEGKLIESSKEPWMKYLAEVDFPNRAEDTTFRCPPERLCGSVPSVNLATLARTGESGEIRLFTYSIGDLLDDRREGKTGKIKGQPLAIIRLSLELQRQFITAIYADLIL